MQEGRVLFDFLLGPMCSFALPHFRAGSHSGFKIYGDLAVRPQAMFARRDEVHYALDHSTELIPKSMNRDSFWHASDQRNTRRAANKSVVATVSTARAAGGTNY
jgi:hypothetical protein